jgi:hypothetical protein
MTNKPLLLGLAGVVLALTLASPCFAQGSAWPLAHLNVVFDRHGNASFTMTVMMAGSAELPRLQQALAEVAGCSADEVSALSTGMVCTLQVEKKPVLVRESLVVEGTLDWTPVLNELRRLKIPTLAVILNYPRLGFKETSGPYTPMTFLGTDVENRSIAVDAPAEPVQIAFGYHPMDLLRLLPPGVVLLAMVLAILTLRTWALRHSRTADPVAVWFTYWCWQGWLVRLAWCAWLIVILLPDVGKFIYFLADWQGSMSPYVAGLVCFVVPLVLVLFLCARLGYRVFALVPELGWNQGRVRREVLGGHGGRETGLLFGAVMISVLTAIGPEGTFPTTVFEWSVFGGAIVLVTMLGHSRTGIDTRTPFPKDEVRARLNDLAEDAQVTVKEAYLLPRERWRLVNVFGEAGPVVHLSREVFPFLKGREVDALLAQELAFIWCRRWAWTFWLLQGLVVLFAAAGLVLAYLLHVPLQRVWPVFIVPVFFVVPLVRRPVRRFGRELDLETVRLTRDAEALITALAKLERLNLLPLSESGWDPARAAGRLQDRLEAIADRAGIPPDRLAEILAGPGSGSEAYPHLVEPAGSEKSLEDTRVFSAAWKKSFTNRQGWKLVGTGLLVPALTVYLVRGLPLPAPARGALYLAALPVTLLLLRWLMIWTGRRGSRQLRRLLLARLEQQGWKPLEWDGQLVGLTPEPWPRIYEGYYAWDLGFLALVGDFLCYLGDRTHFALHRRQVHHLRLGPGPPGWKRNRRVYVTWQDEEHGTSGTFLLNSEDPGARAVDRLAARLAAWRQQPPVGGPLPEPFADLTSPSWGSVTGLSPRMPLASGNLLVSLVAVAVMAAVVSACLGLPFNPHEEGSAWIVVLLLLSLEVLALLPRLLYRDAKPPAGAGEAGPIDPLGSAG